MNGQTKIQLMLELKNKVRMGLNQAKKDTFNSVNTMQAKMDSLKFNFAKNSKAIAAELPMIGSALKLISNPLTATAAGVLAIGKGIDYTTQKAADFNSEFRGLSNLNLDKTKRDISTLRRMVLDTAYNKGFSTTQTITGYFDVQSTTGKYGDEVKRIVEKQGEFANLMQANFNDYIAGTAKGMANFGFSADKLDEYNRSAYATVKVGVTTFDQLAKVQSVYAGAAASNNQTFDTANKLLALFTIKTKSVDEAATLTKSMFNDLTKDTTIKAFKKVGINLYDNNGKIKQADNLMLELNKKFAGLDKDKNVVSLKNQFSGSEGLIAIIQAATDKSGQLQNTFNSFSETKLDMDRTMELTKNDLNYKNEILRNKLSAMEIEIGTSLLPLKAKIAELKLSVIELVNALTIGERGTKKKNYDEGWTKQKGQYEGILNNVSSLTFKEYQEKYSELFTAMKTTKEIYWQSVQNVNQTKLPWGGGLLWTDEQKKIYRERANGYSTEYTKGKYEYAKYLLLEFQKAWQTKNSFSNDTATTVKPKADKTAPTNPVTPPVSDGVGTVVGSARQIRNLTVNIEAFNKGGINTANTTLQHMEPNQIEEWFIDMCMRVVRSIESTY